MLNYLLDLGAGAAAGATNLAESATGTAATGGSAFGTFLPLIIMVVAFYFLLMRPQKKREKETQKMRDQLEVGDEIVTGGGIMGRIVSIHEDTLLIETSSANTKLRIAKWAIQANNSSKERVAEAQAVAKEQAAAEQPQRKGLFGRKKSENEPGEA